MSEQNKLNEIIDALCERFEEKQIKANKKNEVEDHE